MTLPMGGREKGPSEFVCAGENSARGNCFRYDLERAETRRNRVKSFMGQGGTDVVEQGTGGGRGAHSPGYEHMGRTRLSVGGRHIFNVPENREIRRGRRTSLGLGGKELSIQLGTEGMRTCHGTNPVTFSKDEGGRGERGATGHGFVIKGGHGKTSG